MVTGNADLTLGAGARASSFLKTPPTANEIPNSAAQTVVSTSIGRIPIE
jgi:hypothetical protein